MASLNFLRHVDVHEVRRVREDDLPRACTSVGPIIVIGARVGSIVGATNDEGLPLITLIATWLDILDLVNRTKPGPIPITCKKSQ
jgi:hypothetical protein